MVAFLTNLLWQEDKRRFIYMTKPGGVCQACCLYLHWGLANCLQNLFHAPTSHFAVVVFNDLFIEYFIATLEIEVQVLL